jgi:hypothetical protein
MVHEVRQLKNPAHPVRLAGRLCALLALPSQPPLAASAERYGSGLASHHASAAADAPTAARGPSGSVSGGAAWRIAGSGR